MLDRRFAPRRPARFLRVPFALAVSLLTAGCGGAEPPAAMAKEAAGDMAPPPPPPMAAPMAAPGMPGMPAQAGYPQAMPAPADMPAVYETDASGGDKKSDSAPAAPAPAKAPQAKGAPGKAPPADPKPPAPAKAPPVKVAADKGGDKAAAPAQQAPAAPVAPLLIYVGELAMQVADDAAIAPAIDKIIDIAEGMGGYLAGRKDTSVQVRVPSMRFRESLLALEKLGEVTHRSVTADDVSEQYADLEVRLTNLRATQKRLHEFLAKSGTIQDMLEVGRELERVTGEIEAIEGKMRFLRSRAAFSTVTVNLAAKPKATVVAKAETPPPRELSLPIEWLPRVGLDNLLNLH